MKLLWLCNMIPGAVQEQLGVRASGGLWVDHVLQGLMEQSDASIRILCLGLTPAEGSINDRVSYRIFTENLPYVYESELEKLFIKELQFFQPDVIHIWGTEYGHTLAMVNASQKCGMIDRTAVSIQGLCSVIAGHFAEGLPASAEYGFTLRDAVRRDNVALQRRKFVRRGELEVEALRQVKHVIGRTPWDYDCTAKINAERQYHFCNETMRPVFYEGVWNYDSCVKHRIFASNCFFPYKGFHYLLEAFAQVRKVYPDATIAVPGRSFLHLGQRGNGYELYLSRLVQKMHAQAQILFLNDLNADQMRKEYLNANVFVLPSTVENSPNSLAEAMLLGVPAVAADVGGVSAMMRSGEEGYVYSSSDVNRLAQHILDIFAMEDKAAEMGKRAAAHARITHDPEKNLQDLLNIYTELSAATGGCHE